LREKTLLL